MDIQALQFLRNKLSDENTSLAAAKLALEGRLKIVEQEKENIEALKDDATKSNLLIEDEKKQLIVQLNAAMGEKQALESKLSQQQSDIESLEKARQSIIVQVDDLQAEKTDLTEQTQQASREVDALQTVYNVLKSDNRSLFERINNAEKMIEELEADLVSATETIEVKEEQRQVAEQQVKSKQVELTQTVEELSQTSQVLTQTSEQLSQTKVEFSELEQKYLDLVGPARSQLNKYVVRVRYRRQGNRNIIEFARPEGKKLTQVSLPQLHQNLVQLKKQKADELYVKVVIPSDSGLSYDQAWRFTQEILTKYDYYYQ